MSHQHRITPSSAVDGRRLWSRLMEMAQIGATPRGGVNRQALTGDDAKAQALLIEWAQARGFECLTDGIGNLFVRKSGSRPELAPVMTGSHLDTQPSGGRFDGAYGVLAGFETIETLADLRIVTPRSIEVVAWCNEEGCRFDQGCMGSQVFVSPDKLDRMLALRDKAGVTVAQALSAVKDGLPQLDLRPQGAVHAFVEAHIEQGPVLEQTGNTIGVVTGIQGSRRFWIEIRGEDGHAGTLPHSQRKDALFAACDIVKALRELMHDPDDIVRFTIGRFDVLPNAPSVVPGHVGFTIDFRHPDEVVLTSLGDRIEAVCKAHCGPCSVDVTETRRAPVRKFDGPVTQVIAQAADALRYPTMRIPSGAGHDARFLAAICDAGMIFVPCAKGISHNETESASEADLTAGAKVLADVVYELALE